MIWTEINTSIVALLAQDVNLANIWSNLHNVTALVVFLHNNAIGNRQVGLRFCF